MTGKQSTDRSTSLDGILIVNKPAGITSHDVVARVRRRLGIRRVGHTGTLDPLATGVLVLLVGPSTKLFSRFEAMDKTYRAAMLLGRKTTTGDLEGRIIETKPVPPLTEEAVRAVFKRFEGEIEQVPPMVSAVKHKGKRLYELARKGIEVERPSRRVRIRRLSLIRCADDTIEFEVVCSKGTYVRRLAEDIAESLGSVGCISRIERTAVGPFTLNDAVAVDEVSPADVRPIDPTQFETA